MKKNALRLTIKSCEYQECARATRLIKSSVRKINDVARLIRSQSITQAEKNIMFCPTKAAYEIRKALQSVISNDRYLNGVEETPFIMQAIAETAKKIKRIRYAAQGRAHRIIKHMGYIKIILGRQVKNT